jgi:hypothetical protein
MGNIVGVSNNEKKRIINEIIRDIPYRQKCAWNTNDSALRETLNGMWRGDEVTHIDPTIPHPNIVREYILPQYKEYFSHV